MSAPRDPWSDDRLTAAFSARASGDGQAPTGLAEAVISRIRSEARRPRPRFTWSGSFAAAVAALIIVVAVVGLSRSALPNPASQPPAVTAGATNTGSSAGAFTSSSGTAPASPAASPGELEPIDVSDALSIRDRYRDGRELAVSGYLSPLPQLFCPAVPAASNPTALFCPDAFRWLLERPERTVTTGPDASIRQPSGPAFHPSFALVEAPVVAVPAAGPAEAVAVTVVGHFDDRRATVCETSGFGAPATPCRDTFLVDQLRSVGGVDRSVTTTEDPGAAAGRSSAPRRLTEEAVDATVLRVDPDLVVLSRYLTTASRLPRIEPALPFLALLARPEKLVWDVTVLDLSGHGPWFARTLLVPDNGAGVFEVGAGGAVNITPSPLPPAAGGRQSPGAS